MPIGEQTRRGFCTPRSLDGDGYAVPKKKKEAFETKKEIFDEEEKKNRSSRLERSASLLDASAVSGQILG